jgi:hypothetical protein
MNIEHLGLLSLVHEKTDVRKTKNHAQDGGMLSAKRHQHPAILPWFLVLGWRPSFRVKSRAPCPFCPASRIAAGRSSSGLIPSGNRFPLFSDQPKGHDSFCLMSFSHHRFR